MNREIIALCSAIHTEHSVGRTYMYIFFLFFFFFFFLDLMVCKVTTRLLRVNEFGKAYM